MSYIVPKKKPERCTNCLFMDRITYDCILGDDYPDFESQYEHCPLVEIPTPHGRLGDLDKLMTEFMDSDLDHLQRDDWKEVIQIVADAETVIEAEGGARNERHKF